MSRPSGYICRDFGVAGCCSIPDPRYTMRFDDIGEEPIYWCTFCGKRAQALEATINKAFETRPNFAVEFKDAIDNAIQQRSDEHGWCTEEGQESEQAGEGQAQREELHNTEAG